MTALERRVRRVEKAWDEQLTTEIMELLALLSANGMTYEEMSTLINRVIIEEMAGNGRTSDR